jgi:hypothetical protein
LLEDNGADLYKDEDMRLPIVLASFAAVIGLAAPAQADVDGAFWPGSTTPASPIKADLTPSALVGGRAT